MSEFGLAPYDSEEFDRDGAVSRYRKLDGRWFQTRKVRREQDEIMASLINYDLWLMKKEVG